MTGSGPPKSGSIASAPKLATTAGIGASNSNRRPMRHEASMVGGREAGEACVGDDKAVTACNRGRMTRVTAGRPARLVAATTTGVHRVDDKRL
uniref:Uncharacterized protein n=1 Tax=Oryza meridionalis TaxID=40149 RepID=A0A0E0EAH2_9ORYZ